MPFLLYNLLQVSHMASESAACLQQVRSLRLEAEQILGKVGGADSPNDAQQLLTRAQETVTKLERIVRDAAAAGTMQNFDLQSSQSALQSLERDLRTKRERSCI